MRREHGSGFCMEHGNLSSRGTIDQWSLTCGRLFKGRLQAAETVRGEILVWGTGADRPVVVMKVL